MNLDPVPDPDLDPDLDLDLDPSGGDLLSNIDIFEGDFGSREVLCVHGLREFVKLPSS